MVNKVIKQVFTVDNQSFVYAYYIGLKSQERFFDFRPVIFSNYHFFYLYFLLVKNFWNLLLQNTISLGNKHSS